MSSILQSGTLTVFDNTPISVSFSSAYTGTTPPQVLATPYYVSDAGMTNTGTWAIENVGSSGNWTGFKLHIEGNPQLSIKFNYVEIG